MFFGAFAVEACLMIYKEMNFGVTNSDAFISISWICFDSFTSPILSTKKAIAH